MKYVSLLLLIFFFCTQSEAQPIKLHTVTISVQLLNQTTATPKAFVFHFTNPFLSGSVAAEPDARGALTAKGELVVPQNVTVRYNNNFINLWMRPGDSAHLVIDAERLLEKDFAWLSIQGDGAALSAQLNLAHQFVASLEDPQYNLQQTPAEMLAGIRKVHQIKMAHFDGYAQNKELDPLVRSFIDRDILYSISNYITDYVSDTLPAKIKTARIAMFRDSLFGIHEASNFQSMMFAYHLGWYAKWITELDSNVSRNIKAGNYAETLNAGVAVLKNQPPGLCRDYMLYSFLQGICLKEPAVVQLLPRYASLFSQEFVLVCLQRKIDRSLTIDFPTKPLNGLYYLSANGEEQAVPATDFVAWLSKQHAGKVIYVDVYATWCGPCRKELPYVPALQANYTGRDLVFANLCVQDEMDAWKKLVKKEKWKGSHYFLDAEASKLFLGHYRAPGVPVYWLINRDGKLVTTNAPRPSEGKRLKNQLDALLKQQE